MARARLPLENTARATLLRDECQALAASRLTCLSIMRAMASFEVAPTTRSSSLPFLKRMSVGMPLMPYCCETAGLSSTLSLTTVALPAYFSATASTVGASMRHGAHHCAQKSTSTGLSDLRTSASKLLSLTSLTCSLMLLNLLD